MAATYVKISRIQFEDWLFDLCPVFERLDDTEGVYICPLSPHVAVKISSSLGRTDKVVARGAGACHMSIVSRHTKRRLRRPSSSSTDNSYRTCHRTTGWKNNWRDVLHRMFASFKRNREHYNRLGKQTQVEYALEWAHHIENVPNYTNFKILRECREAVLQGAWLTYKQEDAVWKFVKLPRKTKRTNPKPIVAEISERDQKALLTALDKLEAAATTAKDKWTINFASGTLRTRIQRGKKPTERQSQTLREKLRRYNIYVPSVIAA